jgi:hypothetical protein
MGGWGARQGFPFDAVRQADEGYLPIRRPMAKAAAPSNPWPDYRENSDVDILVALPGPVNNAVEEMVFDMAYDIELEYGLVFGTIVYSKNFWYSDRAAAMPLYKNIRREGTLIWMRSWSGTGGKNQKRRLEMPIFFFDQAGFSRRSIEYIMPCFMKSWLFFWPKIFPRQGIRALFNEHFVRTGKVSVESGRFFSRMFVFRQKGDYADFVQFEEAKIKDWLVLAEKFINELDQVIEKELKAPP